MPVDIRSEVFLHFPVYWQALIFCKAFWMMLKGKKCDVLTE